MTEQFYDKIKDKLTDLLNNVLIDLNYGNFNTTLEYDTGTIYNYKEFAEDMHTMNEISINMNFIDDTYSFDNNNQDGVNSYIVDRNFTSFCKKLQMDIRQGIGVFSNTTSELIDDLCLIRE